MLPDPVTLLLQIDRLIDERSERSERNDESALMLEVGSLLAQAANADLALFAIPNEAQPGTVSLRAVIDRQQILARLENLMPQTQALATSIVESGYSTNALEVEQF